MSIVITGSALVSCLGPTRESTWARVVAGECGIGPMAALESRPADEKGGGQAADIGAIAHSQREVGYLRHTIVDALRDAGLWERSEDGPLAAYDPARAAVVMGTTLHGMRAAGQFLRRDDAALLDRFLAGSVLGRALAGLPMKGPRLSTCSACSSGLGAIALAITLIESGAADIAIAGGYDPVSEYAYAGFDSLRLIATGPLRPFCKGREGMKIAEGYAAVVLERWDRARLRSAHIHAHILGFGETADAHHLTQPHPDGVGAERAIRAALDMAGLDPPAVDLISAHATGTPNNDAAEFSAYVRVFAGALPRTPMAAFKANLGHTLGAAGAVELILASCARRDGIVPPVPNTTPETLEFPVSVHSAAASANIARTLSTSLGFGGANTCMILGGEPTPSASSAPNRVHRVAITGCGIILSGMPDRASLAARIGAKDPTSPGPGPIDEAEFAHLLSARRARRLSDYAKMTLASARRALDDAKVGDAWCQDAAVILGTMVGSTAFCESYYAQIVREGLAAANPVLFAEGVPNAGAAQLSLMLGIKGPCQTVIGSRTAGLDALGLAASRIRTGHWTHAIVGAADEYSPIVNRALAVKGVNPGRPGSSGDVATGAGAIALVVEREDALGARGARPLAWVDRWSWSLSDNLPRLLRDLGSPRRAVTSAYGAPSDLAELSVSSQPGREAWTGCGAPPELLSVGPFAAIAAWLGGRGLEPGAPAAFIAVDCCGSACGVSLVGAAPDQ